MQSSGDRGLSRFELGILNAKETIRNLLLTDVKVKDCRFESVFVCENHMQVSSALSLWGKEAGTMAWLHGGLKSGDSFLDIGANTGLYSISAAHRVGPGGKVYAAESRKSNVGSLLNNISRNGFEDRITVLTAPLTSKRCVANFNHSRVMPASPGSEPGSTPRDGCGGKDFIPDVKELTVGSSLDELLDLKMIDHPEMIRIDLGGIELQVLQGMKQLLVSENRPRSIQVKLGVGGQDDIINFLDLHCYKLYYRHFTFLGEIELEAGKSPSEIAHNAVFVALD